MAAISINVPDTLTQVEQMAVKRHIEKLAMNLSKDNLAFLAEMSERKDVNQKIANKSGLIRTFL